MENFSTDMGYAREMDKHDGLACFKKYFQINDQDLIYLDGNSLGRLPLKTIKHINHVLKNEWGGRLIRGWNETWLNREEDIAARIAAITGAEKDEITVGDSTSVNLFKLIVAALRYQKGRTKIISDVFNFPSDLYIIKGIIDLLDQGHTIYLAESKDNIHIEEKDIQDAIDDDTAVVVLSHVAFKSAYMHNIEKITSEAHKKGALVLWDLSHSVGVTKTDLNKNKVDLAIGCTYKYLNGGPGSPAFLFVKRELQEKLVSPIQGWFGDQKPFDFNLNYTPADGINRFKAGTQTVLSLSALETALDIILEAGIGNIRKKSEKQTDYFIFLVKQRLKHFDFNVASPVNKVFRGSHVSIQHKNAYQICQALIAGSYNKKRIIPDFRTPDNIRFGIAPLYTSYMDIYETIERLHEITTEKTFRSFSKTPKGIT